MSSPANALSAPIPFVWKGQSRPIKAMQWGSVINELENFLIEREATGRLKVMKPLVEAGIITPDQVLEKQLNFADEALNSGRYGFGSERMMSIFRQAVKTEEGKESDSGFGFGLLKLWSLMTGFTVDETLEIMTDPEKKDEFKTKIKLMMGRSMPPKEEEPDPNSQGVVASV